MEYEEQAEYEKMVREAELRASEDRTRAIQTEMMTFNKNPPSMINEQLDLDKELERIDYLLRGYTYEFNPETEEKEWLAPEDSEMIILSDYGVHLIRNTVAWYLNKNTLLSNYDEKTILTKMEDFSSDLNDTIFMEYEKVFQHPSFEDCKKILNDRVENKKKLKSYALEILGKEITEEDEDRIEQEILDQIEPIVERELEKIKQQLIKNKLKRFMLVVRQIQDAIHSTYNRAYGGQERKTAREHAHVSETRGNNPQMPVQQRGGFLDHFRR